ncbi:DNA-binding transcriptional MocR family regulator [Prauserella shujinwangii]|uniref:DNA-binding transcriptional MocR family regulator n=1 Tax=Prauserella shujinwangii TaxID=1453103 RepID=A0A2T0LX80_9PSEU|nr:PLP-dependent aminotransferase family protein [Prauserella shujinwangii]PRX48635.1 DNA-binding transcriptional MocR family regulator [Prauserella shujinwangii]
MAAGDYRAIADAIAAEIAAGRLAPGQRLPPQRRFARRHGIADSTAARVYRELVRRGLVVGEVGRGTFVRAGEPGPEPALAEPGTARVDLELVVPAPSAQAGRLAAAVSALGGPDALAAALHPVGVTGTPGLRAAAAGLLAKADWVPEPERILVAGNGRQAIAAALAALVPSGGRLAVEALTYPLVKGIAARLGVGLVPVETDAEGLVPGALAAAHRATPVRAVYVQPTLHNPLGTTMSAARRAELAATLRALDLPAVEDCVYSFLREETPLAAHAPERTVLVDSLSKRLTPGLTLGFAVASGALADRVATAMRSGAWTPAGFAVAVATRWIGEGAATAVQQDKRQDAALRQEIVRDHLAGFAVRGDPGAYHCWWELPGPWRAETFVAAAARRGIAVTPAGAFAVGSGRAPNAVRLALATPPPATLASALRTLAGLARAEPHDEEPG